jgi:hypothetical protein
MRRYLTQCLIAVLVCILFAIQGQSQESSSRDLVLTGSIIGVKPVTAIGSSKKAEDGFEIELYLQFKNNTDHPLIILHPFEMDGSTNIRFQTDMSPSSDGGTLAKVIPTYVTQDRGYSNHPDPIRKLIIYLQGPGPNIFVFRDVEPHGYFECTDKVIVTNGYRIESKSSGKSNIKVAVPEYPALRIQYLVSPKNRKELADLLLPAKDKWAEIGTLFLDDSGSYDVTSEVILNKLNE